ncbi:FAD-dependent oxidoreductase [Chitinophaga barathri]|uniref:NAD(P)/FAD-dependent oxidoreductase n=1 Tax=Chitinophaga barathri TaxID=1647451 RepID=A0A3N4N4P6_9BACT|nr:FAD-dependent oxidoreductase [Chitinophaga barathri]RPD42593.1 NAD(P)/FAD-dependent oxidoreductase [Chitinophaga barathri]
MKRTTIDPVKKKKLVLIGNGPSGFKFCEKFVKYRLGKQFDLVVYGEEKHPAYDRIHLTDFFAGRSAEKLYLATAAWYAQNKIILKTGQRVVEINREEKLLKTDTGETTSYDTLVLATGSVPFVPPIKNCDLPGVFLYRTLEDLHAIQAFIQKGQRAVVLGGGILGLEAARALMQEGLHTSIVETASHLMPRQLDTEGAAILRQQLETIGLHIHCSKQAKHISGEGIECADGTFIPADIIVISAGIRPRDELARACGLNMGDAGGIVVNNYNLTSDENIFAIGECALSDGKIWGLAAPCFEMAEVVAARLGKIYKVFGGHLPLTKLKVIEVSVTSFGDALGIQPHIALVNSEAGAYKRINISPDGQYVLGGIFVGDTMGSARLFHMQRNRVKITGDPVALITFQAGSTETITSLPDNTVICLCEGVCKGAIVADIRENDLTRLDEVKRATGAGTGCESCTSLLEDLLNEILKQSV